MERLKESLKKEQEKLSELKLKREKLDDRIKEKERLINKYQMMINQEKFSQVNDVISSNGLSLDELMSAIQSGNLLSLQAKIEKQSENKKEVGNENNGI